MPGLNFLIPVLSIVGFTALLVSRLADFGVFSSSENFNAETCQVIANFSTSEDLRIDYSNDLVYLSANDWPTYLSHDFSKTGGIFALDLKQKNAQPKLVSKDQPKIFHPHGIDLYTDPKTKEKVLFVLNHKEDGHSAVEIFDVVDRDTLKHRETLTYEKLINANGIVGVGKRAFYVTQDSKYPLSGFTLVIAVLLGREHGGLFHFDGKQWKTILEDLHLGNGLAVSPDRKYLFVGETNKKRVKVFEGDLPAGDIKFKASYSLDLFPDNIQMDSEGNLWAAGFSNLLVMAEKLKGRDFNVPVKIMRAKFEDGKLVDLSKMLSTIGDDITAQTVVAPYKGKFIMTGIMTPEVRICDIPTNPPKSEIHIDTDL